MKWSPRLSLSVILKKKSSQELFLANRVTVVGLRGTTRRALGASVSIASIVVRASAVVLVVVATVSVGVCDQKKVQKKDQVVLEWSLQLRSLDTKLEQTCFWRLTLTTKETINHQGTYSV